MNHKIDPRIHVGEEYGIFVIEDVLLEKDKYGHWIYKAVCKKCGFERYSHYGGIKSPIVTECTHISSDQNYKKYNIKWDNRRIGDIFIGMKRRCYNKNNKDYERYGARGIKICNEWLNNPKLFEIWATNNGYHNNLTIDRIDEDKDYCPENCRWITLENNSKYKSTTRILNVDGELHTGKDWAKKLHISENQINRYVRKYGEESTIEFIRRALARPEIKENNQYYYNLYMNDSYFYNQSML